MVTLRALYAAAALSVTTNLVFAQAPLSPQEQQMLELSAQVQEKAALAVAQFQERAGGRLDFSEKSLTVVEEMLGEAASYTDQMSERDIKALVELMGSYTLEVARRAHGGNYLWHEKEQQPVLVVGEPSFHIALMTFAKVRGRLGGDKADNIPFFYQGFSARIRSATPGTKALYI